MLISHPEDVWALPEAIQGRVQVPGWKWKASHHSMHILCSCQTDLQGPLTILGHAAVGCHQRAWCVTFHSLCISSDLAIEGSAEPQVSPAEMLFRLETLEYHMQVALCILNNISRQGGTDPSTIPGMDKLLPPVRRSLSPSVHSASASPPQMGMSSLNISDSRSNASSLSDQPGMYILHISHFDLSQFSIAQGSQPSSSTKRRTSKRSKGANSGNSGAS